MSDDAPERITARYYANGIISARRAGEDWVFELGSALGQEEYIRADLSDALTADALDARDARIRAGERERCAKVAAGAFHAIPDDEKEATSALYYDGMEVMGFRIAAAIRAMGDE